MLLLRPNDIFKIFFFLRYFDEFTMKNKPYINNIIKKIDINKTFEYNYILEYIYLCVI